MNIAIIPARAGSKRIKNKNIKLFFGKPLIFYSIKLALKSKLFDKVIVSTDSQKIAKIAKSFGADVPFLRPKNISTDTTITSKVLIHTVKKIELSNIKYICCIYPTAAILKLRYLKKGFEMVKKFNSDCCLGITEYDFPIQRAMQLKGNKTNFYWSKNKNLRSQAFEKLYHDAGQFYWLNSKNFLKHKQLYPKKMNAIKIPRKFVQDIDEIEDFEIAKLKFKSNYY
jgi:pseudaminic acid cytidylyltransferase